MQPARMVAISLAAGASAFARGVRDSAIQYAYSTLRGVLATKYPTSRIQPTLDAVAAEPSAPDGRARVRDALEEAGAGDDVEVLAAAKELADVLRAAREAVAFEDIALLAGVSVRLGDLLRSRVERGAPRAIPPAPAAQPRPIDGLAPRAVKAVRPGGSFHWNTRLPADATDPLPERLAVGTEYELETAIEAAVRGGASTPIARDELPPGIRIVFEVRADGATLRTANASGDFVRSAPLEVGPEGTAAFRVKLVPSSESVALRLDLCAGIALIASQVHRFGDAVRAGAPASQAGTPTAAACDGPSVSPGALATAQDGVRLEVENRGEQFMLRVETGPLTGRWIPAARSARELADTAIRLRSKLVALSGQYVDAPPGGAFGAFQEIGAELHEAFFGHPDDANVSSDLKLVAAAIAQAGRNGPARMQIVAETLPFPWAVVNDAHVYARAPQVQPTEPASHFWGGRFRIDRRVVGNVSHAPSPLLAHEPLRVQSCINPHIDEEQKLAVVEAQRAIFEEIGKVRPHLEAKQRIEDRGAFATWLGDPSACELLYFFCHATAAQTVNELFFGVGTPPEVQAKLLLDAAACDGIDVREMRRLRVPALPGEPFIILNACSSTAGDEAFQSVFLRHFVGTWRARGFLGTDWKVPTAFADAFARKLLALFLKDRRTIAEALEEAARPFLAAGDPFPLVYALYAQPELRAG